MLAVFVVAVQGGICVAQFDPIADIGSGSLSYWFDANDVATITDTGGLVDQWSNKAGANDAIGTAGGRPVFTADAWGPGLNAVTFGTGADGGATDTVLITGANSGFSGSSFGITVFTVSRINSALGTFSSLVSQSDGNVNGGMSYIVANAIGGAAGTDRWAPAGARAADAVVGGIPSVITWSVPDWGSNQTGMNIFYNGVAQPTAPHGGLGGANLVANPLKIGNWQQARTDMVFPGDIAEVLVYDSELSSADREAVEAYLDDKWIVPPPPREDLPISAIDVFAAADQSIDLNRTGNLQPPLAIDRNLASFGSPTPSGNLAPAIIALDLDGSFPVNRLRVAKTDLAACACSDLDALFPLDDHADLEILWTSDTGPLNERTYQRVSDMVNGFEGTELLNATAVNSDGTIFEDGHAAAIDGQWWSVSFAPVDATAIAVRIARSAIDGVDTNVHYGVNEFEVYAVPEPSSLALLVIAVAGFVGSARRRRRTVG